MLLHFIQKITNIFSGSKETKAIKQKKALHPQKRIISKENAEKGEAFEAYVENTLFPEATYKLIKRTDSVQLNKRRFSESSKDPDFLFQCRETGLRFAVEAKFRSTLKDSKLEWCRFDQLNRYTKIDRTNVPVLIVIGFDTNGNPHNPETLYLFRVSEYPHTELFESVLKKIEVTPNIPVPNKIVKELCSVDSSRK